MVHSRLSFRNCAALGIMDRIDRDMDHDGIIDRSELGGRITRKEGREKVIDAPLYQINEFNRA